MGSVPQEGAFKERLEASEGMSYLLLEEKHVSGESERREMLCAWWGMGISKNSLGCCVVQHLREAGNEVHFHKRSRSSHELPPPPGKKSLTFKDSPEPLLLYETVRAPRILGRASGLSNAL